MLEGIFKPKRIAIVGASRTPGKLGHDVLLNATQYGFKGEVIPVNPKADEIADLTCYPSLAKIPGKVDLAVIMVPAPFVEKVIKECGAKKVKFAVIISAGFKETGEAGHALEDKLVKTAAKHGVRIVGPNCLGFINTANKLNASFASGMPSSGNISLVSQSGAMGVAMLDWAYESNLGFAKIVTVGNKADIDEVELLNYLAQDRETKVIMMYLESLDHGRDFMRAAEKVSKRKPIIVLKSGRSEQAKRAVSSHTGSLAGSEQAVNAGFERAGVIRANTVEEFFDLGLAFSLQPVPKGANTVIITNAGGPGIMAVDAVPGTPLHVGELSEGLQAKLATGLPSSASTKNPVDVIGDATPDRYSHALSTALRSPEVDAAIVILTPQVMTDEDAIAQLVAMAQQKYKKPILTSFMGGKDAHSARELLEERGIPNYDTPERAVKALGTMVLHRKKRVEALPAERAASHVKKLPPYGKHVQIRTTEAEAILQSYGINVLASQHIKTVDACDDIEEYPVVMKVASRGVIHKAATGAVLLNIATPQEARKAFMKIQANVMKKAPDAEFEGVVVQPQLEFHKTTKEVIIGMKRDPSFGPVMMFGLGGSLVEIFKDVSFGIAPLTPHAAKEMIHKIHTAPLLAHSDTNVIVDTLVSLSQIALDYPEITEIDINPLIVQRKGRGGAVVDVRMMTT